MFNPEKLLGGMLRSGMGGGVTGSLLSGGAALGLLGVAMEAVEHYMNRPQDASRSMPSAPPPPPPPPPRGGGLQTGPASGPPPPPPIPGSQSAPPPPPPGAAVESGQIAEGADAVLLIRAMIAAAYADGVLDAQERSQIMDRMKSVDLSSEEHEFIVRELLEPRDMQSIVDEVGTAAMARQVYAASLLAITVDTDTETRYMSDLASKLGLDGQTVEAIHRQLGR
jgi:hypothetical protein